MTKSIAMFVAAAAVMIPVTLGFRAQENEATAYPGGYRSWTHIKSGLVGPGSPAYPEYGGIYSVYANEKAMEGYRTRVFPDGSVIVFDVLEAKETKGTTTGEARKFIDVMIKDSRRFAQSDGWGYEKFRGDNQTERALTAKARTDCHSCHTSQKDRGYVFSSFRP
jgi:hypothetical protein